MAIITTMETVTVAETTAVVIVVPTALPQHYRPHYLCRLQYPRHHHYPRRRQNGCAIVPDTTRGREASNAATSNYCVRAFRQLATTVEAMVTPTIASQKQNVKPCKRSSTVPIASSFHNTALWDRRQKN